MKEKLKTAARGAGLSLLVATGLLGGAAWAQAPEPSAPVAAAPMKEFKDERALTLLKAMSDKLAGARTLSFQYRGLLPASGPTGQYINLMAAAHVVMERPHRLRVQARGDLFPSDLYFDGKTVTAVAANQRFYAQREAAGGLVEAFMQGAEPGGDTVAPFLDLLLSDPYAALTRDLSSALWVGQSVVGGVKADHLAFRAKDVDWEIWIGAQDRLPRLMVVSYRTGERHPTFTVDLSEWKVNASVPASTFTPAIPKGAKRIEFKLQGLPAAKP
jgi:hypothetical protein